MDAHGSYTYERVNEVDHILDLPMRHDDPGPHKAEASITIAADEETGRMSTDHKADTLSIPVTDTKSSSQSWAVSWIAILGFVATFIIMLAILEAIYQYSEKHVGLATSSSSKHYLWTYGPTAGKKSFQMIEETTNYPGSPHCSGRIMAAVGLFHQTINALGRDGKRSSHSR
jgi:hypothetical protein